ncbi:hypothetical protein EUX98_g7195 [Antrodiella citrinella]|uniref:Mid2 domain-containing protein n=1 Tax=Antrodiella citrinella TaxID=2447956 RepID=A0A4S4MP29_9APHY|nr:hypothetical protein EUX98_g7195 [Antrodiella citrinella]
MTIKNIPLLYLSFVVLSSTPLARAFPVLEGAPIGLVFNPTHEFVSGARTIRHDVPPVGVPKQQGPSLATAVFPPNEPMPTQIFEDKLAHSTQAPPAPDPPQPVQELEDLEVSPPAPTQAIEAQDKDDIVVTPEESVSVPAPLPSFHPPPISTPASMPTETPATPTETSESAVTGLPTTTLTVSPTSPTATLPGQFYSLSTNPYATFTSYRASASTIKPSVPLPSQEVLGETESAKQSRRTAVVGSLVTIGIVMSLVAFIFCFRCQCCRRKKSSKPLDLLGEDHEREFLSAEEKGKMSPGSSPTLGGLPILRSHATHTVTFADPPDQQEWRMVATTHGGQTEDITHVITGDSFMDVDLNSHSNLFMALEEDQPIQATTNARSSAGAASTGAQSYSTRASTYSSHSLDRPTHASASFDKLNQLASLATAPRSSGSRSRKRSKTETSTSVPAVGPMKSTKSLPSITSYENRFSSDSTRKTTCSGDSEWDVAQAYGARYSKESAAGGSILSTISEATMESVEAVEVGGKQCVLMKGKF